MSKKWGLWTVAQIEPHQNEGPELPLAPEQSAVSIRTPNPNRSKSRIAVIWLAGLATVLMAIYKTMREIVVTKHLNFVYLPK